MSELTTSRYSANEAAMSADFQNGEAREVGNISTLLEKIAESTADVVIAGGAVKERGSPSMNVDISEVLAFCQSTGLLAHSGADIGPVAIDNGDGSDRIDVVEIRQLAESYDEQPRKFRDPVTEAVTTQDVDTKWRYTIEAQVVKGTPGAGVAPSHTSGWIKLAEVLVSAGESTSILDADIENVTGGYDGEATANWTTEDTDTYKLEPLSVLKTLFRVQHKEDGDHIDDFCKAKHLDFGTGAGQVDADVLPLGTDVTNTPTGGTSSSLVAASFVRAALQEIFNRLKDLSGVQDDAVLKRHIGADQVDKTHIDWGTTGDQVCAENLPIKDAGGYLAASETEAALQEVAEESGFTSAALRKTLSFAETVADRDLIGVSRGKFYKARVVKAIDDYSCDSTTHYASMLCDLGDDIFAIVYFDQSDTYTKAKVFQYTSSTDTISLLAGPTTITTAGSITFGYHMINLGSGSFACTYREGTTLKVSVLTYTAPSTLTLAATQTVGTSRYSIQFQGNPIFLMENSGVFTVAYQSATGTTSYLRTYQFTAPSTLSALTSETALAADRILTGATHIGDDHIAVFHRASTPWNSLIEVWKFDGASTISQVADEVDTDMAANNLHVISPEKYQFMVAGAAGNGSTGVPFRLYQFTKKADGEDGEVELLSHALYSYDYLPGELRLDRLNNDHYVFSCRDADVNKQYFSFFQLKNNKFRFNRTPYEIWSTTFSANRGFATLGGGIFVISLGADHVFVFRLPKFIGITLAAGTSGSVQMKGIVSSMSSLTPGVDYRVDYIDASLIEDIEEIGDPVGRALSTTELILS